MQELKKSDFYFDLPQELIAQDPLEDRSSSRLLVLDKETGEMEHRVFHDIVEYLHEGDCLVLNNTKVIPARLMGTKKDTGATIEVLLLKRRENDIWETLVKPGKKAKPGTVITFGEGLLTGTVVDIVDEGNRLIQFSFNIGEWKFFDVIGQERCRKYFAWALILIGCAGLWKIVTNSVNRVLCYFDISTQLWKNVTGEIPQVVFSVIIIYIGVQMIKGKKQQLEDKEREEHDA